MSEQYSSRPKFNSLIGKGGVDNEALFEDETPAKKTIIQDICDKNSKITENVMFSTDWLSKISAAADGGPHSRVCLCLNLCSTPH